MLPVFLFNESIQGSGWTAVGRAGYLPRVPRPGAHLPACKAREVQEEIIGTILQLILLIGLLNLFNLGKLKSKSSGLSFSLSF